MPLLEKLRDGYYWARHADTAQTSLPFIAMLEEGMWYICGIQHPINAEFDPALQIIAPIKPPMH